MYSSINLRAHRLGRVAHALLSGRGCTGEVLAVVSNAAYLLTDDGELFWLAHTGLPAHVRAILTPLDEDRLAVGMRFVVHAARLQIADCLTVDCASAEPWTCAPIPPAHVAPPDVVRERARELRRRFGVSAAMPDSAQRTLHAIAHACANRDMAAIADQGKALIGLGRGLTPAGDDFMGGLLFAAHQVRLADADLFACDAEPVEALLAYARTHTNRISYTILSDQARGDSVEPLHTLIAALLDQQNVADLAASARRVLAIGSTSGAEMLAGVMTGMQWLTGPLSSELMPDA